MTAVQWYQSVMNNPVCKRNRLNQEKQGAAFHRMQLTMSHQQAISQHSMYLAHQDIVWRESPGIGLVRVQFHDKYLC
jgi:hypothetical protein